MEVKKSQKADLENKRGLFLEIGLALTLALVFLAFEWRVDTSEAGVLVAEQEVQAEEEIIPITRQEPIKPPPPPPPAPKVADVLNIVDNDEEIDDELEIEDSEADMDEEVEIQIVEEAEEEDEQQVFVIVEDMPEFPGGDIELQKWINSSVKYPVIAQENGITGRVYVGFVVNKVGQVENVKIMRGVDPSLDKEALRVINKMPKWKPGKQRGKAVKVSYTVPINFQLQ
ncbi:energy transducer TonB [Ancylomarina sp. 16SWW S1-10-2]|uniref:energy transducer TonB n=1 Tax=Ancylomarina sp. 16SWW S1-10-2 TaxID=2499681 RepID=UPI0012AD5A39|nr:energy transducer TonB [Ancylomarina sp. 16SWW S1-10-2]MRT91605.1 energy transducer TonB [Ancylomarina sp. 16SWW S1-10-2]